MYKTVKIAISLQDMKRQKSIYTKSIKEHILFKLHVFSPRNIPDLEKRIKNILEKHMLTKTYIFYEKFTNKKGNNY